MFASALLFVSGLVAAFCQPNIKGALALGINLVAASMYMKTAIGTLLLPKSRGRQIHRNLTRRVDWLCTYPLLTIEVLLLVKHDTLPLHDPWRYLGIYALATATILGDIVPRAYAARVQEAASLYVGGFLFALAFFVGTCVLLLTTETPDGTDHHTFLWWNIGLWTAYALVAIVELIRDTMDPRLDKTVVQSCEDMPIETDPPLILILDYLSTLLDILSKVGMAVYVIFFYSDSD